MRIAYVSTFYPFRGGIAQFNASLYREFEKLAEIQAYTFTRQYPAFLFPGQSQFVSENDTADKILANRILDTINPLTWGKTAREIQKFHPDLVLTKFWMPFFAPSLGRVTRILRKKGTKSIAILDNVIPHEKRIFDTTLIKYFLNSQDGFIVMSHKVADDLHKFLPDAKYEFFPHPIYSHFQEQIPQKIAREKLQIPENKKVLLFFGFIRDYKGLDILLRAMKLLPEDYHLIIAGEVYGNFDKYQEIIDNSQLSNSITLLNRYITDDEVPAIFSASDVCVLPYRSATQSGIIGVAYQYNLPVIATDVGGLREMIEPYHTGLMVDKIDEMELAATIQYYFTQNLKNELSKNIDLFKSKYNWENLAKKILELYNRI
ncbi:MAG TPA: glycosyltransferase family 4 protein [Bacteroidota bacterium]|nr:glycosyltransferase family 4 protein [Bacteroidota bacterium]